MRISSSLFTAALPLLASVEASPFWSGRNHGNAQRRHPHPAQLAQEKEVVVLDERGLPITTTTTLWHVVTETQTVWVDATHAQHPFEPSVRPTISASESLDAESVTPSPTAIPRPSHASGHSSVITETSTYSEALTTASDASETSLEAESATSSIRSVSPTESVESVAESTSTSVHASHSSAHSASSIDSATSAKLTDWAMSSFTVSAEESSSALSASRPSSASMASPTIGASVSDSASAIPTASAAVESASASDSASAMASASTTSVDAASASESASASASASATSVDAASTTETTSPTTSVAEPTASASTGGGLQPVPRTLMAGYYPDWSAWYLTPEQVDWNRFDIMDFAFAIPTAAGGLEFTQWDSSDLLHRLVTTAHAAGKRVKLSIGGWTGSQYFSTIAADDGLRGTFVQAMVDAYWTYKLDGIDIDWEYPNAPGAYGNAVSSADSANFLTLLQQLRAALPDGAIITLATQVWPFADENGSPLGDVSGFAAVIDWILIMNYDIWSSSSNPGPNAPLNDACGTSTQPLANAYAAVSSWTQAGMPANQITLGVPAYGYLSQSTNDNLRTRNLPESLFERDLMQNGEYVLGQGFPLGGQDGQIGLRERSRRSLEKRFVTVSSGWSTSEGQVMWHDLVGQGALARGSNGHWVGAGGFERKWDTCSSTPFLKSTQSGQIISYDDPDSMSLKAQFAKQAGLRGCNVFSVDGDYTAGAWPLTDAVRSGLGLW